MSDDFANSYLERSIALMVHNIGFTNADMSAIKKLTRVATLLFQNLCRRTLAANQKIDPLERSLLAIKDAGVDLEDLWGYINNVQPFSLPQKVPIFPVVAHRFDQCPSSSFTALDQRQTVVIEKGIQQLQLGKPPLLGWSLVDEASQGDIWRRKLAQNLSLDESYHVGILLREDKVIDDFNKFTFCDKSANDMKIKIGLTEQQNKALDNTYDSLATPLMTIKKPVKSRKLNGELKQKKHVTKKRTPSSTKKSSSSNDNKKLVDELLQNSARIKKSVLLWRTGNSNKEQQQIYMIEDTPNRQIQPEEFPKIPTPSKDPRKKPKADFLNKFFGPCYIPVQSSTAQFRYDGNNNEEQKMDCSGNSIEILDDSVVILEHLKPREKQQSDITTSSSKKKKRNRMLKSRWSRGKKNNKKASISNDGPKTMPKEKEEKIEVFREHTLLEIDITDIDKPGPSGIKTHQNTTNNNSLDEETMTNTTTSSDTRDEQQMGAFGGFPDIIVTRSSTRSRTQRALFESLERVKALSSEGHTPQSRLSQSGMRIRINRKFAKNSFRANKDNGVNKQGVEKNTPRGTPKMA